MKSDWPTLDLTDGKSVKQPPLSKRVSLLHVGNKWNRLENCLVRQEKIEPDLPNETCPIKSDILACSFR